MQNNLLRHKMLGGLLGKAVGGTLGAPYEGCRGPLKLKYYDPVPDKMLPNDDLDLQILWACKLRDEWNGILSCDNLAEAWLNCVAFPFDEYGIAIRNIKLGLRGKAIGIYDNAFSDGLGAAIRSEIWAYLAPGDPELAMKYAKIDGCIDHCGSGLEAAMWLAALESMAFTEPDINKLIKKSIELLPKKSLLRDVVKETIKICKKSDSFKNIRKKILSEFGCNNFTDVHQNLAFVTAALIMGKGDFSKSICTAVNFGCDTDCTGATVGAILGIIDPDGIPKKWLKPIGNALVVSKEITGINPPATLDEFADLILELRKSIKIVDDSKQDIPEKQLEISGRSYTVSNWFADDFRKCPVQAPKTKQELKFSGNYVEVDFSGLKPDTLLVYEVDFNITEEDDYIVMLSTEANMRAWIDGNYAFGQESGPFLPALHRTPLNQRTTLKLAKGRHTLSFGLAPLYEEMDSAPVFFAVGKKSTRMHVHDAFERKIINR